MLRNSGFVDNVMFITGPPKGPLLFCSLASVVVVVCRLSSVVVCNTSGRRAGERASLPPGARSVGRPRLHGGPVVLRPVRATPCWNRPYSVGSSSACVFYAGFLVDYISHPVINSFTTAAAITIAASQLKVSVQHR